MATNRWCSHAVFTLQVARERVFKERFYWDKTRLSQRDVDASVLRLVENMDNLWCSGTVNVLRKTSAVSRNGWHVPRSTCLSQWHCKLFMEILYWIVKEDDLLRSGLQERWERGQIRFLRFRFSKEFWIIFHSVFLRSFHFHSISFYLVKGQPTRDSISLIEGISSDIALSV